MSIDEFMFERQREKESILRTAGQPQRKPRTPGVIREIVAAMAEHQSYCGCSCCSSVGKILTREGLWEVECGLCGDTPCSCHSSDRCSECDMGDCPWC